MTFSVHIVLEPPAASNLVIQNVVVEGQPDKPNLSTIPGGNMRLQGTIHRCHIQAWSIIVQSIAQQMRGATLRTAAKAIFGLSDFQANNVSAVQIKEFMESRAREILVSLQKDVNNYYAGRAADNLRAGGILGSNKNMLKQLHSNLPNRQLTDSEYRNYRNLAGQYQIAAFRAGYDESPFFDNTAKLALARGEYVARWYQIYYGGEPDSTIYAKFLIEDGTAAIDNLIQNGS